MKFNKLSFIFLTLALVILISFNVSANVTTRSLPTIYKVTGDLNLTNPGNNSYFLVAAVQNYAVGKSGCYNYEGMQTQLTNGIFIGPIPSSIVGHTSKNFDLRLILKQYPSSSYCAAANNVVIINEGPVVTSIGGASN